MDPMIDLATIATPAVLVDRAKLAANIRAMQATCDAHGVELRPHIKTHKMVAVARQQLAAGARGLTCAKLGEAEAILPSGVRSIFVAHSLVDPGQAPRLAARRQHERVQRGEQVAMQRRFRDHGRMQGDERLEVMPPDEVEDFLVIGRGGDGPA